MACPAKEAPGRRPKGWGKEVGLVPGYREEARQRQRPEKAGRPCMPCKKLGIYSVEGRKNHLLNDPDMYLLQ